MTKALTGAFSCENGRGKSDHDAQNSLPSAWNDGRA